MQCTIILLSKIESFEITALFFYHCFQLCHFSHPINRFPNVFRVRLVPRFLPDYPLISHSYYSYPHVLANYTSWYHLPHSHCCLHIILHPPCLEQSPTSICCFLSLLSIISLLRELTSLREPSLIKIRDSWDYNRHHLTSLSNASFLHF